MKEQLKMRHHPPQQSRWSYGHQTLCAQAVSGHRFSLHHDQLVVGHEIVSLAPWGLSQRHLGWAWPVLEKMHVSVLL
jgi:hypothetical protein